MRIHAHRLSRGLRHFLTHDEGILRRAVVIDVRVDNAEALCQIHIEGHLVARAHVQPDTTTPTNDRVSGQLGRRNKGSNQCARASEMTWRS